MSYNTEEFYAELYKTLDKDDEYDDCCLITGEKLDEKSVKLDCGHAFNYAPLFKDVLNHKQKFNVMETKLGAVQLNEIRCPYCRTKQPGVLPFHAELGFEKTNGINAYAEPTQCCFMSPNPNFLENEPEHPLLNFKLLQCRCRGVAFDKPFYCLKHERIVVKREKALAKEQEKVAKEQAKVAKEQAKVAKEEAKMEKAQLALQKKIAKEQEKVAKEQEKLKKILEKEYTRLAKENAKKLAKDNKQI
jgi:hypothetical protein